MTAKPFRRYWAITPDGLALVLKEDHGQGGSACAFLQLKERTRWILLHHIRPATFSEFCWRDDGFAGTHYGLFFTVFAFCIALTIGGILGSFPELWGKVTCILAGPAIMGTWVFGTWMNFKRFWV